jgi:hypothetical protein
MYPSALQPSNCQILLTIMKTRDFGLESRVNLESIRVGSAHRIGLSDNI